MVEQHIVDFLDMKGEAAGLGFYSEKAMESVHHNFKVNNIHKGLLWFIFQFYFQLFWEKVKVGIDHPEFGARLKAAVSAYNARHL